MRMNNTIDAEQIKSDILAKYEQLLDNFEHVYVFGAARLGLRCVEACKKKGIKVHGLIDNDKKLQGKIINGVNVYSLDYYLENGKSVPIVIATLNYWSELEEQLVSHGLNNYLHYNILNIWAPESFQPAEECFYDMIEDVMYNIKKYQNLREKLVDERSRIIMDELLKFRMTMEIEHTRRAYSLSMEKGVQYFDIDIMKFEESGIYIDGGAYKGETSKALICELQKQRKQYSQIYVIEPDSNLIKDAHKQLAVNNNITYCSIGLSDRSELLKFNYTGDTGGSI